MSSHATDLAVYAKYSSSHLSTIGDHGPVELMGPTIDTPKASKGQKNGEAVSPPQPIRGRHKLPQAENGFGTFDRTHMMTTKCLEYGGMSILQWRHRVTEDPWIYYCKTLYFSCILIWRIWSLEISLHFNLALCHGLL